MQSVQFWQSVVEIAVSLGAAAVFGFVLRHAWSRYRWRGFKEAVIDWFDLVAASVIDHPKTMSDDDWNVSAETMLSDVGYSPFESQQLLQLAVVTAKGIVASRLV